MKLALLQLNSGDDPNLNLVHTCALIEEAAAKGAEFVLTPEVTNCVSLDRGHQQDVLVGEADDKLLSAIREQADALGVWVSLGSLALKTGDPDGRFANRSILISPDGAIIARYDKIHMFDVSLGDGENFRESDGYRAGEMAVVSKVSNVPVGMSICYDLRFPNLYQELARAGAQILLVPSAFSPTTGAAHWETLLRARAIETGCFVVAAAQTGVHPSSTDRVRTTYGHSLVIDPWGTVLLDAGTSPGISVIDIDLTAVSKARSRVPAISSGRSFEGP